MAGTRIFIDFFIKDKTPAQLASQYPEALQKIRELKALATKLPNEYSIKATYHVCYHDEATNKPCGEEKDI